MLTLHGYGVGDGIAIGRALLVDDLTRQAERLEISPESVKGEVRRFRAALEQARAQLKVSIDGLASDSPPELGLLMEAHLMMLDDPVIAQEPARTIEKELCNAAWALEQHGRDLAKRFDAMDDPYLRSKKIDVAQIVSQIRSKLEQADQPTVDRSPLGRIVLANDLSPSDAVLLQSQQISAFVTNLGGPISHTAILARSLRIPAIVGMHGALRYVHDGEQIIVDGDNGIIIVDPDASIIAEYKARQRQLDRHNTQLRSLKDKDSTTVDGQHVELLANIELPEEVDNARDVQAHGVGLFRTEYLFMNRDQPPDEEEQYLAYRYVVESLKRPVTIRTLDIGADKNADAIIPVRPSTNPALGLRAVRLCLNDPSIFRPQIRAILRASAHGRVELMIPMVSSIHELDRVLDMIAELKRELAREGKDFDRNMAVGGMVEVPAAAISAEMFADKLDFLSIGTNDLIQYTLAIDRVDDDVNYLYDPLHPAVLRLIDFTIQAGARAGIPVAMCGEMAGDPAYTRLLLGMGLKHFSMDPLRLLAVKQLVKNSDIVKLSTEAREILSCTDPDDLKNRVEALQALDVA